MYWLNFWDVTSRLYSSWCQRYWRGRCHYSQRSVPHWGSSCSGGRLLVLHGLSLHEPAHIPDAEHQVRPGVKQVAKATNDVSVLCCVHYLRRAVAAQLQSFFHRSVGGVVAIHPSQLNNAWRSELDEDWNLCLAEPRFWDRNREVTHMKVAFICALNSSTSWSSHQWWWDCWRRHLPAEQSGHCPINTPPPHGYSIGSPSSRVFCLAWRPMLAINGDSIENLVQ